MTNDFPLTPEQQRRVARLRAVLDQGMARLIELRPLVEALADDHFDPTDELHCAMVQPLATIAAALLMERDFNFEILNRPTSNGDQNEN